MANFEFLPDLASMLSPLYALLQKEKKWTWGKSQDKAFEAVKELLKSSRPVGFASQTLTKAERKYSQLDKEALAIVFGVKKYHQSLYRRCFVIRTDHKPLTHIFLESRVIPAMASGRIQRWALTLGAYDYAIEFKEGKEMLTH